MRGNDGTSNISPAILHINLGCNSYAAPIRGRIGEEGVRYRVFCGTCHKNSYEDYPLAEGVTRFKKNKCSNADKHLGFPCVVNLLTNQQNNLRCYLFHCLFQMMIYKN